MLTQSKQEVRGKEPEMMGYGERPEYLAVGTRITYPAWGGTVIGAVTDLCSIGGISYYMVHPDDTGIMVRVPVPCDFDGIQLVTRNGQEAPIPKEMRSGIAPTYDATATGYDDDDDDDDDDGWIDSSDQCDWCNTHQDDDETSNIIPFPVR